MLSVEPKRGPSNKTLKLTEHHEKSAQKLREHGGWSAQIDNERSACA